MLLHFPSLLQTHSQIADNDLINGVNTVIIYYVCKHSLSKLCIHAILAFQLIIKKKKPKAHINYFLQIIQQYQLWVMFLSFIL